MATLELKGKRFMKCPHCKRKIVLKLAVKKDEVSETWEIYANSIKINDVLAEIDILEELKEIIIEYKKTISNQETKIEELDASLEAMTDY